MGLIDKYKDALREQGLRQNVPVYKVRHNKTNIYLLLLIIAVGAPIYILIYGNYAYCNSNVGVIGSVVPVTSTIAISCGIDAIMYSITAALVIALMVFLVLKALKYRRIG